MSLGYRKRIELITLNLSNSLPSRVHYQPEPVNMRGKVINWSKNKDNGPKGRDTHPRLKSK
jgi:hypothetical protein